MAVYPDNTLQNVATFGARSGLANLQNRACLIHIANKKYENFQKEPASYGTVKNIGLTPRAVAASGLVPVWQGAQQRVISITVDQAANAAYALDDIQRLYNIEKDNLDYNDDFRASFMAELGANIEANLGLNFDSLVQARNPVTNTLTGEYNSQSGAYRFYGNGVTPIDSYTQLARAEARYRNYGADKNGFKVVLVDTMIPDIIGSGLNQFAPERNNKDAMSWEIGEFGTPRNTYYASNMMPTHVSGNTGILGQTLTVISTNDPTGQNITQLVLSGATPNDPEAVMPSDKLQFEDGVSGFQDLRYLTFIGHIPSSNPVQVRVVNSLPVAADGAGQVVVDIFPALVSSGGSNFNITQNVLPGMRLLTFPTSKICGIVGGNAFFVVMAKLPTRHPYTTAIEVDETTGAMIRGVFGATEMYGVDQGYVLSAAWGAVATPEYMFNFMVPMSQT